MSGSESGDDGADDPAGLSPQEAAEAIAPSPPQSTSEAEGQNEGQTTGQDQATEGSTALVERPAQADGASETSGAEAAEGLNGAADVGNSIVPSAVIVQPVTFAPRLHDPEYSNAVHQAAHATNVANTLAGVIAKAAESLNKIAGNGMIISPEIASMNASLSAIRTHAPSQAFNDESAVAANANRTIPSENAPTTPLPVAKPVVEANAAEESSGVQAIDDFEVKILTSTHFRGKKLMPGGDAKATRLGTTCRSSGCTAIFPHVLGMTEPEGEGEEQVPAREYFSVQTDKNVSIRVRLYRKSHRSGGTRSVIDEAELISTLNNTRATADEPYTDKLQFRMELFFDALDEKGEPLVPIGGGVEKTFDRAVINSQTGESQLMNPEEKFDTCPYYLGDMRQGMLDFNFRFAAGCVSYKTIPRKSSFVIVARCTHPRLKHLKCTSPPFQISSKFAYLGSHLERGEMYVQNPEAGGDPIRVIHRKRQRDPQDSEEA